MILQLFYFYLGVLGVASFVAAVQFRKLSLSFRFLAVLIWTYLITEISAYYAALNYGNNYKVYNIFEFVEFPLICLYFNYAIDTFRRRHIGYYIAAVGIVFNVGNLYFWQALDEPNVLFLAFETVSIVFMSMYSIFRMFLFREGSKFRNNLHYLVAYLFIFNWMSTYLHWGMESYITDLFLNKGISLQIIIILINIIINSLFIGAFFAFPKFKNTQ